jgi:hypothetical protein
VNVGSRDCQRDGNEALSGHAANKLWVKGAWSLMLRAAQKFHNHSGSKFVGVAFIVATMLGVSHAAEWTDYIPPCPDAFVKAWDAWDQSDPANMPPLPQEPCLLISWSHAYICSQKEGGCANRE